MQAGVLSARDILHTLQQRFDREDELFVHAEWDLYMNLRKERPTVELRINSFDSSRQHFRIHKNLPASCQLSTLVYVSSPHGVNKT